MIEIKNITKRFDSLEVLKGVDITIPDHEIVSIVGASGAGKTTLLQIVGTLEKPTSGSILFDGKRVDNLPDKEMAGFRNANIGFVFQFHQLLPEFTAFENDTGYDRRMSQSRCRKTCKPIARLFGTDQSLFA